MRPIDIEKYILCITQLNTGQRETCAVKVGEMLCDLINRQDGTMIDINRSGIIMTYKGLTRIYRIDEEVDENMNNVVKRKLTKK